MRLTFQAREAGDSAAARFTGYKRFCFAILGLTPQALCLRLLRRLRNHLCDRHGACSSSRLEDELPMKPRHQ